MRNLEHPPLQLQATAGRPLDIVLDGAPGAGLLWHCLLYTSPSPRD